MITIVASLLLAQTSTAQTAQATPPPPLCASEAHAAFDFWVGEWDVYPTAGGNKVAESSIRRLHNGCAVREQWMPLGGAGGSSLNSLDTATGRWNQVWIGSGGGTVHFEGGLVDGAMVLNGYWSNINGPGQHGLVRMTYTPGEDGSVRQFGQVSFDHGLTWQVSFDFTYRAKPEAEG